MFTLTTTELSDGVAYRPMEPQPWSQPFQIHGDTKPRRWYVRPQTLQALRGAVVGRHWDCPVHPGDRIPIREEWWQDSRWPECTAIYVAEPEYGVVSVNPNKVIRSTYPDGGLPTREASDRNCRECKWKSIQPAETLPDWAIRKWATVTSVAPVKRERWEWEIRFEKGANP